MEVVGVETQNVSQINTGVYVGTGRVEEIKAVAHMMGAEVIIFDNTLSPMQLRNLKDIIERPVFDRTHLILQIFSSRARTFYWYRTSSSRCIWLAKFLFDDFHSLYPAVVITNDRSRVI